MRKIGFDTEKYIELQSKNIIDRVSKFSKLYLEFGGKLFDDNHASRVLPGFAPDQKIKMLISIRDKVEMILVINSDDIEKNKERSDLGITYEQDLMRLIDAFELCNLKIAGVIITRYEKQPQAQKLRKQLEKAGYKVAYHYTIENYPNDINNILSPNGFGRNEYIETTKEIVVVTAPGPGSGKMATCLSQMYHDNIKGIKSGYAKFETFPIWNLSLNHPVNLAYEAATVDLNDVNLIDPFHLESYKEVATSYNRDVEAFPILNDLLIKVSGKQIYKSPTDMGVNMIGFCISDDEACKEASRNEIVRRYYDLQIKKYKEDATEDQLAKLEIIMKKAEASIENRKVIETAKKLAEKTNEPAVAIELPNGQIITGKTSKLMGAASACLLNCAKVCGNVPDVKILSEEILKPIQILKTQYLKGNNPRLHADEILIALAMDSQSNKYCSDALNALSLLKGSEAHSSVILSEVDINVYKKLGINLTMEPIYQGKKLYHSK